MKTSLSVKIAFFGTLLAASAWLAISSNSPKRIASVNPMATANSIENQDAQVIHSDYEADLIQDNQVQLCQGYAYGGGCDTCGPGAMAPAFGYGSIADAGMPSKHYGGVNQDTEFAFGEAKWRHQSDIPFEQYAYGEYLDRTPHVPEYRLRVDDELEFVYLRTREKSLEPYQLYVGDQIQISSTIDPTLDQPGAGAQVPGLTIRSDGMISLSLIGQVRAAGKTVEDLQRELNERYVKFVKNPAIVVQVIQGNTPLQDLVDSVDARAGSGGQSRAVVVSPDGTVQLPGIGSVPAIGLTLNEIAREVNARYRLRQGDNLSLSDQPLCCKLSLWLKAN